MKIAKEITLWSLDVYKIHIKEWPTVKDKILSLVPWDDINQRKNPSASDHHGRRSLPWAKNGEEEAGLGCKVHQRTRQSSNPQ